MTQPDSFHANDTQPARFAVIGNPVKHSRSPSIHQRFARQTGINLAYTRLEAPTDQFDSYVQDFFAAGGRGLNVTVPFKQQAWQLACDHLSARAQQAEAVNTLWMRDNVLHGCNTDGIGLVKDLARLGFDCKNARILMIGAGGAARGVMGPLLETGCAHLHIVNRTPARADELVSHWNKNNLNGSQHISSGALPQAKRSGGWDLVLNASASSLSDSAPDVPAGLYSEHGLGYDMMYGARATPFMQQALADGAQQVADGLGMLVGQAAESFYIWHGVTPEVLPVIEAIRAELDQSLA